MPATVPVTPRGGAVSSSPRAPSAGDRTRERLYSYAHVRRVEQLYRREADAAADAAPLFHPRISDVARSSNVHRRPLYAPPRAAPPPSADTDERLSSPVAGKAAQLTEAQLRSFLARTAAYEQRRDARLQATKLQMAEEALRACTFRPTLSAPPPVRSAEVGESVVPAERQCWADLTAFNEAMEVVREELAAVVARCGR